MLSLIDIALDLNGFRHPYCFTGFATQQFHL
jgi:hypothetical protein